MRRFLPFAALLGVAFVLGCQDQAVGPDGLVPQFAKPGGFTLVVPPSSDVNGVTDAKNIEDALNTVGAGGTVYLTDGNASTVDHYVVSQGIVVLDGFSGTLRGEGKHKTVIEAVRGPGGTPFEFSFNSRYVQSVWPTVFHFEYPDDVTIRDLSITQSDPAPNADYFQHIAIYGGDHNAIITNVRLQDPEMQATSVGIHVMPGSVVQARDVPSNLGISNVEIDGVALGITVMWYGEGSAITIDDIRGSNAITDIWAQAIEYSSLEITGSTFTASRREAIHLRGVRNATITGNTFRDGHFTEWWHSSIYVRHRVHDSRIAYNTFENLSGVIGQAIFMRGTERWPVTGNTIEHNTFTKSGLPGWTVEYPNGPGAVWLGASTSDNYVDEMKFPPGTGTALCQMIVDFTDEEATPEYDGANTIHNWQPCENLAERDERKAEFEFESGFDRGH